MAVEADRLTNTKKVCLPSFPGTLRFVASFASPSHPLINSIYLTYRLVYLKLKRLNILTMSTGAIFFV